MPDSDVHYACDWRWWNSYNGLPEYKGLKLCQDNNFDATEWNIKNVTVNRAVDHLLVSQFGILGWGGNSGFHALNLAVQFGCSKILLVGFDMTLVHGIHWHGPHKTLNNPNPGNVARWRNAIDNANITLNGLGICVINCSAISMLQNYQKMNLQEALENVEDGISGTSSEHNGDTRQGAAEDLFNS